ncbi:MAG: ion channel [Fibrobacterota bacterium]
MYILRLLRHTLREITSADLVIPLAAVFLNICFGVLFYLVESPVQDISLSDSLWWAMVTMTTVGYGDFYAQTDIGRYLISYPVMILGVGIMGYFIGMAANLIIDLGRRKRLGIMDVLFDNHVVICNYPGEEIFLQILNELQHSYLYGSRRVVLVTDDLTELPSALSKKNCAFIAGNPAYESILKKANVSAAAAVLVLSRDPADPASDERTCMISSGVKNLTESQSSTPRVIVQVVAEESMPVIRRQSVDGYTNRKSLDGRMLVQELVNPGISGIFSEILSNTHGSELYIFPTALTGMAVGRVQIAAIKNSINLQVLGVLRGEQSFLNPDNDMQIRDGDRLVVLARSYRDYGALETIIQS